MAGVSAAARFWPRVVGFALVCQVAPAGAQSSSIAQVSRELPSAAVGPILGSGARQVPPRPAAGGSQVSRDQVSRSAAQNAVPTSPPRGKPPPVPSPSLPEGVAPTEPSPAVRRLVSRAPSEPSPAQRSVELEALAQAEKLLFPRARLATPAAPGFGQLAPTTELHVSGPPPLATAIAPEPVLALPKADALWLNSLSMPDLPVRMDPRVVKYLKFYRDSERGRGIARVWARRSGRYAPALRAIFERAGLPVDLMWLSLIESGHDPGIRSHAGALGLWQFMRGTAKMYGLTVDRWVDERLDPERSTLAAVRFLKDLHRRFGNWELAMAAYNMGYGGLSRAIRKYNTNDFWLLSRYEAGIPWETTLYVPKILAIAIVMNNKQAFGLTDVVPEPAAPFDTVLVPPGRALSDVAGAAGLSEAELMAYNPHLVGQRTPPSASGLVVHLPAGSREQATARLAALPRSALVSHAARFGDTLAELAAERGVDLGRLLQLNPFGADEAIPTGTLLLLPPATVRQTVPGPRRIAAVPASNFADASRRRVFYSVRHGDSLLQVASAFGVTRHQVMLWNHLDDSARLHDGLILQIFVERDQSLSHIRHLESEAVEVLPAGSEAFYDQAEEQKGRVRLVLEAKAGDTLASVGRRFGLRVASMERINRRSRREKLTPGEPVVVYVKPWRARQVAAGKPASRATPLPSIEPVDEAVLPSLLAAGPLAADAAPKATP